jgi:hypothetical protein
MVLGAPPGLVGSAYVSARGPIPTLGLAGWWDASDAATITSSAGKVSQWNDKSGGGRHLTQATSAAQPTLATVNGRNAIQFDGVDDILSNPSVIPTTLDAHAMFVVVRSDGAQSTPGGYTASALANGDYWGIGLSLLIAYSTNVGLLRSGHGTTPGTSLSPTSGVHLMSATTTGAGSLLFHYNAVQEATAPTASGVAPPGGLLTVGANPPAFTKGTVCEALIYNRTITVAERQQIEQYLLTKWKWTPTSFSPLSIPWHSAFWASDPQWIPPANGAPVGAWRNAGSCGIGLTAGVATYRASYANLNGRPAIEYNGTTDNSRASTPSIAQPNHVFAVGWLDSTSGATAVLLDGTSGRHFIRTVPAGTVELHAGASPPAIAGAGGSGPFALAVLFNQAASKLRAEGVEYVVPSTVGTSAFGGLGIGAISGGVSFKGGLGFIGVSDTELTAQQLYDLEQWARDFYDVPVTPVPLSISGLAGWWDASDASTFTYSSGSVVSQWNDKSGNARHASQSTVANQPVRNGTQNGQATVVFDGTNDYLATPSFTLAQPLTMIVACNMDASANTHNLISSIGGSLQLYQPSVATQMGMYAGSVTGVGGLSTYAPHVWVAEFNSATSKLYQNGADKGTVDPGTLGTTTGVYIGAERGLSGGWGMKGPIFEVLLYNRVLTTTERQQIEMYLKQKWGTP